MLPLRQELEQRGLLNQYTDAQLFDLYDQGGQKFYFGMDPTADSLHLGNFVNFINAVHLMRRGNTMIPLVGGATGMIGDPGGRDSERSFLDEKTLTHNVKAIQTQIEQLITNIKQVVTEDLESAPVFNNKTFYEECSFLEFLRDVGKYITVNSMMTRETVKKRLTEPDQSISFTEFSYMLIQGNDFYRLFDEYDCKLQIAGSDQWGNITVGTELIRKKLGKTAYGFTCPLILDSNGKKFGKSEGNALFLDPRKTSSLTLYQYFLNVSDADVERFLKLLTFYDLEEIDEIIAQHAQYPERRYGQKVLAQYIVRLIVGKQAATQAENITSILFGHGDTLQLVRGMSESDIQALNHETGGVTIDLSSGAEVEGSLSLKDLLIQSGLAASGREAKQFIIDGAVSLNEEKITDLDRIITSDDIINGVVILRRGKKGFKVVKVDEDPSV